MTHQLQDNVDALFGLNDDDDDDIALSQLDADFDIAVGHVRRFSSKLDQSTLLYLYGRYKIATEGVCTSPKPGLFDFRGRQKWEAWKSLGDMNKDSAKSEYISMVNDKLVSFVNDENNEKSKSNGSAGLGLTISKFVIDDELINSDSDSPTDRWLNSVKTDNVELCKLQLAEDSSLLNVVDQQRMSALHWAADRRSLKVLEWLFSNEIVEIVKPIIDAQDIDGQTALHYASSCDHLDVARLLLQRGANVDLCDNDGNSPFDVAASDDMKSLLKNA